MTGERCDTARSFARQAFHFLDLRVDLRDRQIRTEIVVQYAGLTGRSESYIAEKNLAGGGRVI